jgi:hypothetical protein
MCATPVMKGQPAPYDGQCLTTALAVQLALKADSCDARIEIEVEHVRKMERLDVERMQKLSTIDKESNAERNQVLMEQLKSEQAWWKQPAFVIPVTALVTIGLVWVTGEALHGIGR